MTRAAPDKIVLLCGEFDKLELSDIRFLQKAKKLGDMLFVGVHSDEWMKLCRDGSNHTHEQRREIVGAIEDVDAVYTFDDSDGTACQLIKIVKFCFPNSKIIYASNESMHDMPETRIRGVVIEIIK